MARLVAATEAAARNPLRPSMTMPVWRRISPARYVAGDVWEVRRLAPGVWAVLRWDVDRSKWLVIKDQIPTKTKAMDEADRLRG